MRLLVLAVVLVGVFALSAAPALADEAPEAPVVSKPVYISTAVVGFEGVLNPGKTGAEGTFESNEFFFIYDKSSSQCTGGGRTLVEASHGAGREHVELYEGGLEPGTEYTACLVTRSLVEHKEAVSAPVTFKTREVPVTLIPTPVTATTATLHGTLNPNGEAEPGLYDFVYAASSTECEGEGGGEAPKGPAGVATGKQGQSVEVTIGGLLPAATYTVCLVTHNSQAGTPVKGAPVTFTTPRGAPQISEERAPSVASSTATVSAEINPGALPTGYHVEYVSQGQFEAHGFSEAQRVPAGADAELPAVNTPLPVNEKLSALQAGTTYRFRFVATNEAERAGVAGAEATFTTVSSAAAASALPDERAYELVSAPGSGEPYLPPTPLGEKPEAVGFRTGLPFRAASNGEAVAYAAEPSATSGTGELGPAEGNQWLARRGSSGWQTEDITPVENSKAIYEAFSDDLATAFYEGDATPLAEGVEKGCAVLYTRGGGDGAFGALFTSGETPENCGHPLFAGAAAGESQVYFQSEAALTAGAGEAELPPERKEHRAKPNIGEGCQFGCNLYESVAGGLQLVNELDGHAVPSATFGGYSPSKNELADVEESELPNLSDAISTDGSRVFWTDTQSGSKDFEHVYVRENGTSTVQVSGSGPAEYWAASADGRYAYYTENGELWRFDTSAEPEPEPRKPLASKGLKGENADVQGVIGTNQAGEEGSYVYFVAGGVLSTNKREYRNARGAVVTEEATPQTCEKPVNGEAVGTLCNLYVLHDHTTSFIASLSGRDNELQSVTVGFNDTGGDWRTGLGERTAQLTPDGRHLVFESIEELTGYESGVSPPEPGVFVYSADSAGLACVSCSPTGAEPVAPLEEEVKFASKLPVSREAKTFMHRWISEDGARIFFDSSQPLVSQDKDGVQDVYEWERPAEPGETGNSCTAASASPVTGGCTYLLSGGASTSDSFLLDADAPGDNVFFEHVGPLGQVHAPVDHNELYDARVDGGFPEPSLACTGTGCQGVPPAPPIFATPSSVTFSGEGNPPPPAPAKAVVKSLTRAQKLAKALKACAKDKNKRKRATCRAQARKKYNAKSKARNKKAKKVGAERGAKA